MSSGKPVLGVLGGSGLYSLDGLTVIEQAKVVTPFGEPSAPPVVGNLQGQTVVFIPRHGPGHRILPSEINFRANVHAFRQLGVERVVSVSAVGSLREGIQPGDFVLVDQFIDKTHRRASTFFGEGVVGHVSFAEPICPELADLVGAAAREVGFQSAADEERSSWPAAGRGHRIYRHGTYVCMEGPQFSTRAESLLHRTWGADVVGMTAATEAKLCREAEICYCSLALATDYDCWRPEEESVTSMSVLEILNQNVDRAKAILRAVLPRLGAARTCGCGHAAANAIFTARDGIPAAARDRLQVLFGRYL